MISEVLVDRYPIIVVMNYRFKYFLVLLLAVINHNIFAKNTVDDCIKNNLVIGTNLDTLTVQLITNVPSGEFYMFGETHNYLANNDLLLTLIKLLHSKGVYNVVNELPQATCFLFNEYLSTGNDSLLAMIKPKATYNVLKDIRTFNQLQSANKRIKFFGIDYVSKDDAENLITALKIILSRSSAEENLIKSQLVRFAGKATLYSEDIKALNKLLSANLVGYSCNYYKNCFKGDYNDLLLMSHNYIGFKGRTDEHIYAGFKAMFELFFNDNHDERPKFLSFYGAFHLKKFGAYLQSRDDSPVKGKVIRIGLQYYDCYGEFPWQEEKLGSNGISFYYNNKYFGTIRNSLYLKQGMQIGILPNKNCFKSKWGNPTLDGLMFFKQYGTRRMNSWKFD